MRKRLTALLLICGLVISQWTIPSFAGQDDEVNGGITGIQNSAAFAGEDYAYPDSAGETDNPEADRLVKEGITIYGLNDSWDDFSIPSDMPKSYSLKSVFSKNAVYSVKSGESVTVNDVGFVYPVVEEVYSYSYVTGEYALINEVQFGDSVLLVQDSGKSYEIPVSVVDYADYYARGLMDQYLADHISTSMSGYEKLVTIAEFAAGYDYSAEHSGYASMIIYGGGDCWASSAAIEYMCLKIGFSARIRDASSDEGAGALHENVVVNIDGKTYIVDAGYTGTAPRYYSITEMTKMYRYELYDAEDTIRILEYYGADEDLVIPEKIDGKTVKAIGKYSMDGLDFLQSVVLPDTVEAIYKDAFSGCDNLSHIKLSKNLTFIDEWAFYSCDQLESIEFPDSLEEIGEYCFEYCRSLRKIVIPENVKVVGVRAFEYCSAVEEIIFKGTGPEEIKFRAFAGTKISKVTLPSGLKILSDDAFTASTLTRVDVDKANKTFTSVDGVVFSKDKTRLVLYPTGKGGQLYRIPDTVTVLGEGCFEECTGPYELIVPASVKTIEDSAFGGADGISHIWFEGDVPDCSDAESRNTIFAHYVKRYSHTIYYPAGNAAWAEHPLKCNDNLTLYWAESLPVPVLDSVTQDGNAVTLTWNAADGAESYLILRKEDDGVWYYVGESETTSYVDDTVSEGHEYTYSVRCGYSYWMEAFVEYSMYDDKGLSIRFGSVKEGWKKNSNGWWYQNADGTSPKDTWKKIDGKWYHFDAKGYMQTGWLKIDDTWYYLKSNGTMATGWLKIGSDYYYFNSNGSMAKNTWKGDYYLTSSGKMARDTWVGDKYVNASGKYDSSKVKAGWKKNSTGWWYQNADGTYPKNTWKKIDGEWYHFDAKGYMQTGWLKIDDTWYYLKSNGTMAAGWLKIGSDYYYFNSNGSMAKNTWKGDYYLTSSGKMARNTWIGKYHVDENGKWDMTAR